MRFMKQNFYVNQSNRIQIEFCQAYLVTSNFSMERSYNNEHNTLRSITSVAKKKTPLNHCKIVCNVPDWIQNHKLMELPPVVCPKKVCT